MLGPLVILALLSLVGGWVGMERFGAFLAPSTGLNELAGGSATLEWTLTGLAVLVAIVGWGTAHSLYRGPADREEALATPAPGVYKLLLNKYWVDELYAAVIVRPLYLLSQFVLEWVVEVGILGALVFLIGGVTTLIGAILQRWQSGNLRSYAAWLAAGAAAVLLFLLGPWGEVLAHLPLVHAAVAGH